MRPTFSEDDVGKTVGNVDGTAVGNVATVEGGVAAVDTDPGLGDSIRAALGRETEPDQLARVDASDVAEITDDAVRLAGVESGERDLGPTSGEIGDTTPRDEESEDEEEDVAAGERPPGATGRSRGIAGRRTAADGPVDDRPIPPRRGASRLDSRQSIHSGTDLSEVLFCSGANECMVP